MEHEQLKKPAAAEYWLRPQVACSLDEIVVRNLKERLFTSDRLATLLQTLAHRRSAKSQVEDNRLPSLQPQLTETEERLKQLYRSIEDGVVELDDILRERTAPLQIQSHGKWP
ncbi:hypothetical protein V1281_004352 [Nitrobacteraceae bacterium AZCC 2161]